MSGTVMKKICFLKNEIDYVKQYASPYIVLSKVRVGYIMNVGQSVAEEPWGGVK